MNKISVLSMIKPDYLFMCKGHIFEDSTEVVWYIPRLWTSGQNTHDGASYDSARNGHDRTLWEKEKTVRDGTRASSFRETSLNCHFLPYNSSLTRAECACFPTCPFLGREAAKTRLLPNLASSHIQRVFAYWKV